MKWTDDGFELASGRKVYANRGIVGISPGWRDPHWGGITEGYDGPINVEGDYDAVPWTPEERCELAEAMIQLWTDFGSAP